MSPPTASPEARRLRILFLSREYPPWTGGGGIGSYVETMAHALARRGNEVHVLSCSEGQGPRTTTMMAYVFISGVSPDSSQS